MGNTHGRSRGWLSPAAAGLPLRVGQPGWLWFSPSHRPITPSRPHQSPPCNGTGKIPGDLAGTASGSSGDRGKWGHGGPAAISTGGPGRLERGVGEK